ncbi:MAG: isovaleryl-CoA dehydrogenase, partial [Cocleimonas sp.]
MISYPTLNFDLGETVDMLQNVVQQFAVTEVAPYASEIDISNEFPNQLWPVLGEMGLLGITVPEEYGGSNMGYLAHMIAMEEISRASASIGLSYGAHSNLCVNQI